MFVVTNQIQKQMGTRLSVIDGWYKRKNLNVKLNIPILDGIYLQIAGAVPIGILIRSGVNLINGSVLPPSLLILGKTESYEHKQEIYQFHNFRTGQLY